MRRRSLIQGKAVGAEAVLCTRTEAGGQQESMAAGVAVAGAGAGAGAGANSLSRICWKSSKTRR